HPASDPSGYGPPRRSIRLRERARGPAPRGPARPKEPSAAANPRGRAARTGAREIAGRPHLRRTGIVRERSWRRRRPCSTYTTPKAVAVQRPNPAAATSPRGHADLVDLPYVLVVPPW